MKNFFDDNEDILFHIDTMDLDEIVRLKEDDFSDAPNYPEAPHDTEDARDNYKRVLSLLGGISAQDIAPAAKDVDRTGATFSDGTVRYAPETVDAIERLKSAELMGFTLPRKYGGLNFPKTIYTMAIELVSRADASLMTLFGLQEISDTINNFGSDEQREKYLPLFSSGSVMGAMALTEPDAGSDLMSVALKATLNNDGLWHLSGVKRFITNGCADIILVMARSEEGTTDARGLSLFIYQRDNNIVVRRIEDKLGIHGSPTCELQFNDAEAELLGVRKRGLIKYTMSLMNGARLAVAAQAVGIMEAAYREARNYAANRVQFGVAIETFPPVYEMLTNMKINLEAARSLLYETARTVDKKEGIEKIIEAHPERKKELSSKLRSASQYADLLTPMIKRFATERGNRICTDALQVHGGVGYTRDFPVERLCRDMRITNIYEGTTQMQVLAAIGPVMRGTPFLLIDEYEENNDFGPVEELINDARKCREYLKQAVDFVTQKNDPVFKDYHAGRLVEIATETIVSYLMAIDALKNERKKKVARLFISSALNTVKSLTEQILTDEAGVIELHGDVIG